MERSLTKNEESVLIALATNHYSIGDDEGGATWTGCVNHARRPSGIEGKSLSGVVSSLQKKGWIKCDGTGRDAQISWASLDAYNEANKLL